MSYKVFFILPIMFIGTTQGMDYLSKWENLRSSFNPIQYIDLAKPLPTYPKRTVQEIEELAKKYKVENVVKTVGEEVFFDSSKESSPTALHLVKNFDSILTETPILQRFNQKKHLLDLLDNVIKTERDLNKNGYYTFVHAQQKSFYFPIRLYTFLWSIKNLKNIHDFSFLHVKESRQNIFSGMYEEIQKYFLYKFGSIRSIWENNLLFMNYALFANYLHAGSSTITFLTGNYNVSNKSKGFSLSSFNMCKLMGYSEVGEAFKNELQQLEDAYKSLSKFGNIMLIAVPEDKINDLVYPAYPHGLRKNICIKSLENTTMDSIMKILTKEPHYMDMMDSTEFCLLMSGKKSGLNPSSGIKIFPIISGDSERLQEIQKKESELFKRIEAFIEDKQRILQKDTSKSVVSIERANKILGHLAQPQEDSLIHPVWHASYAGKNLTRTEKLDAFAEICKKLAPLNSKIPAKTSDICRVATYNVHFWQNPYSFWGKLGDDFDKMIEVIKKVNPDILILEEVGGPISPMDKLFNDTFSQMGYAYRAFCSTNTTGVNVASGRLCNCILSKYPFESAPVKKQFNTNPDTRIGQNNEQRCFVGASVLLPNNKKVSVYGTHLEVRPIKMRNASSAVRNITPETARKEQLQELVKHITDADNNENIIIGADFNASRAQDLQYKIGAKTLLNILEENWNNLLNEMGTPARLGSLVDQKPAFFALEYLMQQGWKESFELSGFTQPQFTTWSGTRIDFLFLNPSWNLPIKGSYVVYDSASDHLPVIMDIDLTK